MLDKVNNHSSFSIVTGKVYIIRRQIVYRHSSFELLGEWFVMIFHISKAFGKVWHTALVINVVLGVLLSHMVMHSVHHWTIDLLYYIQRSTIRCINNPVASAKFTPWLTCVLMKTYVSSTDTSINKLVSWQTYLRKNWNSINLFKI